MDGSRPCFKERNVGFMLYRHSLKLNMVWRHMALLLLEVWPLRAVVELNC